MNYTKRFLILVILSLAFGQAFTQMTILSGPERGSYHQFANDIAALLGEKNGILLENQTSAGSGASFKALTDPNSNVKMALIQSDFLHLMEAEDKVNNTYKTSSIKVVMPLAAEQIHMVARKSSGLTGLQDLDGKIVGIGTKDQGGYATARRMRVQSQINWRTQHVDFEEMLKRLSEKSIDVGLVVGSAPMNMFQIDPQVMVDGMSLLTLEDSNGWAQHYNKDTIYSENYEWLDKDIATFGVRTLLIVNVEKLTAEEKETVGVIKSSIIQNLDQLKQQGHPRWSTVVVPE